MRTLLGAVLIAIGILIAGFCGPCLLILDDFGYGEPTRWPFVVGLLLGIASIVGGVFLVRTRGR